MTQRWRPRLRWVAGGVGVVVLLFASLNVYRHSVQVDRWERLVARVRARGQPTSIAEIRQQYPFNPVARTNWLELESVYDGLVAAPPVSVENWLLGETLPQGGVLPGLCAREAAAWLAPHVDLLDRIAPMLERELDFGYPITTNRFSFNNLKWGHQQACFLYVMRAALASEAGDPKAAVVLLTRGLELTRHVGDDGDWTGCIVRMHLVRMLPATLGLMLNRGQLTETQLQRLQQTFHRLSDAPSYRQTQRRQWAEWQSYFQESARRSPDFRWGYSPQFILFELVYFLSGSKRGDLLDSLELWDEQIEGLSGPLAIRQARTREVDGRRSLIGKRWNRPMTRVQGDSYLPQIDQELWSDGWLRSAVTALAVERFRLRHCRLPESLSDLVPDFLPHVLLDPIDEQPLHYRVEPSGYVVYSIGPDGVDDGGRPTVFRASTNTPAPGPADAAMRVLKATR